MTEYTHEDVIYNGSEAAYNRLQRLVNADEIGQARRVAQDLTQEGRDHIRMMARYDLDEHPWNEVAKWILMMV